jgi:hypothetical protein
MRLDMSNFPLPEVDLRIVKRSGGYNPTQIALLQCQHGTRPL